MPSPDASTVKQALQGRYADFYGQFTDLKLQGGEWRGPCPVHGGDGDNFTVNAEEGTWYCHTGCKQGGDAITFLEKKEGLSFPEALARLADEAQVSAPARTHAPRSQRQDAGRSGPRKERTPLGPIVATYDYTDEAGVVLFQVTRHEPKDFRQRRPDGKGGWVWSLSGVRLVLYRLPGVLAAVAAGEPVYVVEGEKDADALAALGLCATTSPMGAGKWRKDYAEVLRGGDLIVLPDSDPPDPKTGRVPGSKHAADIARTIWGKAKRVKVMLLPGLPEKGDVSDWLAAGGTAALLQRLVDATPPYAGPPAADLASTAKGTSEPTDRREGFRLTDFGNAERLIARHGQDLRHSPALGWLIWDGKRWVRDDSGEVMRRMKHTVRQIYAEAAALTQQAAALPISGDAGAEDPNREKAAQFSKLAAGLADWAKKSEAAPRLEAAIKLAISEPGVYVDTRALDTDPWLLNCQNGTLDLRSGELAPHDRSHLMTKISPVAHDADAQAPLWAACLETWQPDADVRRFLRRAAGYSLTGHTGEETAFFLYGTGRNGKSKFTEALQGVLGEYAVRVPIEVLMGNGRGEAEGATPQVAKLAGARLVIASEIKQSKRLDESFVKDVTGGDLLTARHLYSEAFEFKPVLKLWIYGNHKPQIVGTDEGIWSRLPLIPFTVTIPKERRDEFLSTKLQEEYPGILAWAVRGCLEWQRGKLAPPPAVVEASAAYREEMDPLAGFFESSCVFTSRAWTPTVRLRAAYERWADAEGADKASRMTPNEFGERLRQRGCAADKRKREGVSERGWRGVGLISDAPDPAPGTPGTPGDATLGKVFQEIDSRKDFSENDAPGVPGVPEGDEMGWGDTSQRNSTAEHVQDTSDTSDTEFPISKQKSFFMRPNREILSEVSEVSGEKATALTPSDVPHVPLNGQHPAPVAPPVKEQAGTDAALEMDDLGLDPFAPGPVSDMGAGAPPTATPAPSSHAFAPSQRRPVELCLAESDWAAGVVAFLKYYGLKGEAELSPQRRDLLSEIRPLHAEKHGPGA